MEDRSARLSQIAEEISVRKGITPQRALQKMEEIERILGISAEEYFEKNYYEYTNYHLIEILCAPTEDQIIDRMTDVICMRLGISKSDAKARIDHISATFGLTPQVIMFQNFYKCTDSMIRRRLDMGLTEWSYTMDFRLRFFDAAKHKRMAELQDLFGILPSTSANFINRPNNEIFAEKEKIDPALVRSLESQAAKVHMTVADFFRERKLTLLAFGDGREHYDGLGFVARTKENIGTFILDSDMRYLHTKHNCHSSKNILDNKALFAKHFKDLCGRNYWINDGKDDYASFEVFFNNRKYQDIIVKPLGGICGHGIERCIVGNRSAQEVYLELKDKHGVIVEELVVQHPVMQQFGKGAVNTLRIPTILNHGEPDFLYAVLRIGRNSLVDNFHSGGFVARVDLETGIIESNGCLANGTPVLCDPDSKKTIRGTQLPHWDKVIQLVKDAARLLPKVGLVGWDVAITEDGPILIEGNSNPMLTLYEFTFPKKRYGHRDILRRYLDEPENCL